MGDLPTPTLMANYNKVILMGNLTRDPEPRTTQSGLNVCKLGLAVNRKWDGETTTCFVDLTAFGKSAEILTQYCKKGDPLHVDGRLDFSTWEGKDGSKRNKLEVIVENFQLMGNRSESEDAAPRTAPKDAMPF